MKAMILTASDEYVLDDIAEPKPGPGEVAIRVAYAGLQWGDVLVRQGHFPVPRPFVSGFEAAGRIVAVGEGVETTRVGEAVATLTGSGAFAEVVVADARLTFPVGDFPLRAAAGFGWIVPTAFDLVSTVTRVRPGESVLIHAAAGGVGTVAAQLARNAGAKRIVGVVGRAEQVAYAERSGYAAVVTEDAFPDAFGGERFDVILDPIGGSARSASLALLAPHGRLVAYGNIATFDDVSASVNGLLMEGKSILTYNSHLLSRTHPERLAASARAALAHLVRGDIVQDISVEVALEELASGVERLAEGKTLGKSVVRVAA